MSAETVDTDTPDHAWRDCRTCVNRWLAADLADGGLDAATVLTLMTEARGLPRLCRHDLDDSDR